MKGRWVTFCAPIFAAGVISVTFFVGAGSLSPGSLVQGVPKGQAVPTEVLGETLTAATICPAGQFCISGSTSGIGPTTPQNLTLTLINPNTFPIYVTNLTVSAGTVGSCIGAATLASPGWKAVSTSPLPADAIPVPAASGSGSSGYGQASKTVALSWTDSLTVDQTPCLSTATKPVSIPLSFGGSALSFGNCITGSQSGGLTVPAGQIDCVSATGKVTGGITVPSGAGLVLDPGASVTGGIKETVGASETLLCGASITGGVTVSNGTGPVIVGSGNYCAGNSISGGLVLTNNTAGIEVVGNKISGGSTVTGNSGTVPASQSGGEPSSVSSNQYIGANNILGGITCTPNNSPGLSNGGSPNSVSGPRSGTQCSGSF